MIRPRLPRAALRPRWIPPVLVAFGLVLGLVLVPAAARAQTCTGVAFDLPTSGNLEFGRLYVTAGASGTATLEPATGLVTTSGRLVSAQGGAPLLIRVIDASPTCEFLLTVVPASRDLAPAFIAVADRISVLEGTLLNADPAQREWLVRMNNGVARIAVGGVLEMNTASDSLIDSYTVTFTVAVNPP